VYSASVVTRKWLDAWRRLSGRGTYPHEFAFLLLLPFRSLILSPRKLVARLHLEIGARVLELGPGPGFFSMRVARSIPRGHLFLVDLQREMLEKARLRIRRAGVANVSFTQAGADALPFAADSFDVAFLVTVLGEVPSAGACLEAIRYSLVPGGILSISELPGDPDAMAEAEVAALARSAGFEFAESFRVRGGFTANFRKPRDHCEARIRELRDAGTSVK
jgi:ubiquinone/menaquinone biosynthesis C-methylase UbiE